jgi:hypothetical protein
MQRIRGRDATNTLRILWIYFTSGVSPSSVSGSYNGSSATAQNITTGACMAIPVGGTGPFTYTWTQSGTSSYTWTISAASTSTTTFTALAIPLGVDASADFICTITDTATGLVTVTQIISASVQNNSTA